jgi:hypothetical protein
MKSRPLALTLLIALFLACVAAGVALWDHFRLIYPSSETKSSFLKSYTPQPVIDGFRDLSQGSSYGQHQGSGAGRNSVAESSRFEFYIVLRHDQWMPLMTALEADALQQLAQNGANVVSRTGNPRNGFHLDYKITQSIGSLTILPLALTSPAPTGPPLPQGVNHVTVKIEQSETWFPKGTRTIADSRLSSGHRTCQLHSVENPILVSRQQA